MGKLHELLAVEQELKDGKEKAIKETKGLFEQVPFFQGGIKTLHMFDENRSNEEAAGMEFTEVVKVVPEVLSETFKEIIKFWDLKLQKDAANQCACADIVVNGEKIVEKVPAVTLLALETELREIRGVLEKIPMLNTAVEWEPDKQKGKGRWKTKSPQIRNKTEKKWRYKTIVPAEENGDHPAQVHQYQEDTPVGQYTTVMWSGLIFEKDKRKLIANVSELLKAVKKARQQANCQTVEDRHIGKVLSEFILTY